jgi:hypothetical protein
VSHYCAIACADTVRQVFIIDGHEIYRRSSFLCEFNCPLKGSVHGDKETAEKVRRQGSFEAASNIREPASRDAADGSGELWLPNLPQRPT